MRIQLLEVETNTLDQKPARPRLGILLSTYRRPNKLLRLLDTLSWLERKDLPVDVTLVILDDSDDRGSTELWLKHYSKSPLAVPTHIVIRRRNLGQGPNFVQGMLDFKHFDLYWPVTDDDLPREAETVRFIDTVVQEAPTVAVCEFRQGPSHEFGTFFEQAQGVQEGQDLDLEPVIRFGKGTNMIFKRPSEAILSVWASRFCGSMYEDKALALLLLVSDRSPKLIIYPELAITADSDFGRLRYSMRAFANLERVALEVRRMFPSDSLNLVWRNSKFHGEWWWWLRGLVHHVEPRGTFRYRTPTLLRELAFPLLRVLDHLMSTGEDRWVTWITWRRRPAAISSRGDLHMELHPTPGKDPAEPTSVNFLSKFNTWSRGAVSAGLPVN